MNDEVGKYVGTVVTCKNRITLNGGMYILSELSKFKYNRYLNAKDTVHN